MSESPDRDPLSARLAAVAKALAALEAQGITVRTGDITLHLTDPADAAAVAFELGLPERRESHPYRWFRNERGTGLDVVVFDEEAERVSA